ncbi:DNA-binding transcriptional ArsR family regulator [Arcanobacterium wilhelmae]|uniref:DNA-binding transcriptional ArsR family regulator n=1 Tax=Arcanobacterium wilhelmae TaxID=1803177 RepID=A0ABT9N9A8_9ACTO|nr:metalloregulator ArsR/SmtB family transcription factor [Arcanobacterium wilhelmae]MDP9800292.1 DNA-binding transcriptional ArsR family regulator [Arcanobacterium wilhelmae]WFN89729.1 metalloregulator ArsR/SmtB family transcription factor [Arcanobacterium wilhelmae]
MSKTNENEEREQCDALAETAALFKALGSPKRLALVSLMTKKAMTVSELAQAANMAQPLASQHLKVLREAGIVTSIREGMSVRYELADHHVAHIVEDALLHTAEPHTHTSGTQPTNN